MIKDKARELAEAILKTKEYAEYKRARRRLERDQENYEILEMYRQRQWELQLDSILGREPEWEEEEEEEEDVFTGLADNENVNQFLLAEYRFTRILTEVQDILLDSIENRKGDEGDISLH